MYKHIGKVVIELLRGSAVTKTTLGGLTIYPQVANFPQCITVYVPKIMKIVWQ